MRNLRIIMLEKDEKYGGRLCSYLMHREGSPFSLSLHLEHPVKDEKEWDDAEMVLVDADLLSLYEGALPPSKTVVLDRQGRGEYGSFRAIYKYQPASEIYRELMYQCIDNGSVISPERNARRKFRTIVCTAALYSKTVAGRICQMFDSTNSGENTLYIPLSHVSAYLDREDHLEGEGVSDLIYLVKQRKSNLGARIGLMTHRSGNDYVLPALSFEEAQELTGEDWKFLIAQIGRESDYEKVILDCGSESIPAELALLCDEVILFREDRLWDRTIAKRMKFRLDRLLPGELGEHITEILIE